MTEDDDDDDDGGASFSFALVFSNEQHDWCPSATALRDSTPLVGKVGKTAIRLQRSSQSSEYFRPVRKVKLPITTYWGMKT
jgi:hypothetical protein